MATRKPRPIEDIEKIVDHAERAREAVTFAEYAEGRARRGRAVRDEALRALKAAGVSIPQISERTGVNANTVKVVTR